MRSTWRLLVWWGLVLAAILSPGRGVAGEAADVAPLAVLLSDDEDTRGDWIGTYGTYAYMLCGMRAPESLYGGEGWPLGFSATTGDPAEEARAWRSSMPAHGDRTVLLEPNGLTRTPASFDDHGETRPLGEGPDLHLRIEIPPDLFLLSLYFFEIDWIQYRAYRIRVQVADEAGPPLLVTGISDFMRGKYKRFVVQGPTELLLVIERGNSPNAELSGIFLDRLTFPTMAAFDMMQVPLAGDPAAPAAGLSEADAAADDALARPPEGRGAGAVTEYVAREREFFSAAKEAHDSQPESYYGRLETIWQGNAKRIEQALALPADGDTRLQLILLQYYAARAQRDEAMARRHAGEAAEHLLAAGIASKSPSPDELRLLDDCSLVLGSEGRRADAAPFLLAFGELCLQQRNPHVAREKLVTVGRRAMKAGVPLPIAGALAQWQAKHGTLDTEERLLLGSLYYIGGRSQDALKWLTSAEQEMEPGQRHRWCLVAMATSCLRSDELGEAEELAARLAADYPDAAEVDEMAYRVGVYHFNKRDMAEALKCFEGLMSETSSEAYQSLCSEYLGRIYHLQGIDRQREPGD